MSASVSSPALIPGAVLAQSGDWVVKYDVDVKIVLVIHPTFGPMGIRHVTRMVICHHQPTDRSVVFARKKKNWYDSRMRPAMKQLRWHSKDLTEVKDWRSENISPREVVAEIARMGGGDAAAGIVAEINALAKPEED